MRDDAPLIALEAAYRLIASAYEDFPSRHTVLGQETLSLMRDTIAQARGEDSFDVQARFEQECYGRQFDDVGASESDIEGLDGGELQRDPRSLPDR